MTISIWRYSHLTLAISSALFITIAALTGIILAFEPISNKLKPYAPEALNTIYIAETIGVLQAKYKEIVTIEVDENEFVSASVITKKGESKTFYINPKTGENIGSTIEKLGVFKFATTLHRSLFLKSTGRIVIGFISFLLFLIASTGLLLIAKSQGGIRKIFSKIVKENFHQYYHIILGRLFLIPIVIITLTGVYLSFGKFLLPNENTNNIQELTHTKRANIANITDFEFFKTKKLKDIQKIEFPFSKDQEDYFFVKTIQNKYQIHQFNGQIVRQTKRGFAHLVAYYSLVLHTGKGAIVWAFALLMSCFALLYFIFSGFSMLLKRMKIKTKILNNTTKDEAEIIVLVGSETGSTFPFAQAFEKALSMANKKVFVATLNEYSTYEKAKNLVVFTATYGAGEAPSNASKFLKLLERIPQKNELKYTVVGFGSKKYPGFCTFAVLVHASLQIQQKYTPEMPLFKIDNQKINSFKNWVNEWSTLHDLNLKIDEKNVLEKNKEASFNVANRTKINIDSTFLISLKPDTKMQFTSGDLLAITPNGDNNSRLYSIAKIDNKILLSVKKHEFGGCSSYLNALRKNDCLPGRVQQNENFHFPKKVKDVLLIANGTGIAPFLGMIQENNAVNIHLFWGGRTIESFAIYREYIVAALKNKTLTSFHAAYSKDQKKYVQDLLEDQTALIVSTLKEEGVVLICGSLKMQFAAEKILHKIALKEVNINIEELKEKKQIRTDCY
ncbi:PepSY domain-containing protein [Polaribacter irgensii]|uniref:PepSY domain-containing protein n=1 Tax=Polaribacter irgensii TaxID=531 RepID=UPI0003240AA7|nr:PepSY domain-containing protein [Polaribacter irgensii]